MHDSKDPKAAAEPPLDRRVGHDELSMEEDGDIALDWCTQERDQLSISLRNDGSIAWAVLIADGRKAYGTAQLSPEAFEVLRKLVPN